MVLCYTRDEGQVRIEWGYDDFLGYFLSLYDKRLQLDGDESSEVQRICSRVSEDGSGAYLNLNTGLGSGVEVSQDTMFAFMRRYDIDPDTVCQRRPYGPVVTLDEVADTPEMRIDPRFIEARRRRFGQQIEEIAKSGDIAVLKVARDDRTITELSRIYNIYVARGATPPGEGYETMFFLSLGTLPNYSRECYHPDCCILEVGTEKHRRCAKCKEAFYCSRTCQAADWKSHRLKCQLEEP